MTPKLGLVWAQARGGIIGQDGDMPWHLPADLKHFKAVTLGAPVIMGRRTWESLPERFRPLPGRPNIVVTRSADGVAPGALVVGSPEEALRASAELCAASGSDWAWVMGGGQLYRSAMHLADRLEVTQIHADIPGDTTAPEIGDDWALVLRDPEQGAHLDDASGLSFSFLRYARVSAGGDRA